MRRSGSCAGRCWRASRSFFRSSGWARRASARFTRSSSSSVRCPWRDESSSAASSAPAATSSAPSSSRRPHPRRLRRVCPRAGECRPCRIRLWARRRGCAHWNFGVRLCRPLFRRRSRGRPSPASSRRRPPSSSARSGRASPRTPAATSSFSRSPTSPPRTGSASAAPGRGAGNVASRSNCRAPSCRSTPRARPSSPSTAGWMPTGTGCPMAGSSRTDSRRRSRPTPRRTSTATGSRTWSSS